MDLTNEDVADILAVLDSLPYDELDLQTPRFRLTLRRAAGGGWTEESRILSEPTPSGAVGAGAAVGAGGAVGAGEAAGGIAAQGALDGGAARSESAGGAGGLVAVNAPLPGTFYRAPRPGAPPFVEVGEEVREDTVVAIVETMKLMNSVHAGTRGKVAEIVARNAEATAQGATLMWISPEP